MTDNDKRTTPGTPEGGDPLSATGMFLRAFDSKPEGEENSAEPARRSSPAGAEAGRPFTAGADPSMPAQAGGAGEFTQMFQSLNTRPGPASRPPQSQEAAVPGGATAVFRAAGSPPPPAEAAPGEFTRIFVSEAAPGAPARIAGPGGNAPVAGSPAAGGSGAAGSGASGPSAASSVPATPFSPQAMPSSPKAKGFSSPGVSDSASAEGSFTQFFKAAAPAAPAAPRPAPAAPPTPAAGSGWGQENDWNREPAFRPTEKPKEDSLSVTGLINSLAASTPTTPKAPEPAPYRADPLPFASAPARPPDAWPSEPSGSDAGGVTRLMQRLAHEPPSTPVPPTPAPQTAPPVSSGPGEFTRMIAGLNAAPPPPPTPAAGAAAPFAPPPPFAAPAAPAMPKPPAMPAVPKVAAPPPPPPPAAPAFAMPAPAMPKPAPPPALAAPKGKLEAMVPVLLVINTFLLLVVLVVLIFLIKGR